ncbi:MAG: response regulator transcription factor, partial [Acidimicrobiales bacterium]|nr:response regulator transcription factor [Acidimicrobiales bacterium]
QEPATDALVVLDDENGGGLLRALEGEGHRPIWCRDAASARGQMLGDVDLVLLDLGLPDEDGLDLCRHLRAELPTTPIVILTARSSEADIVVGLDAGADDYLVKPFRLAELFARLRAHLRRVPTADGAAETVLVGDLTVNVAARRAFLAGAEVGLRAKEFDLLAVLVAHAGTVVTRERLMELVWDEHWFGSTKTLDVHIAALRQRFREHGPEGSRITTVRGVGYRYETPTDEPVP